MQTSTQMRKTVQREAKRKKYHVKVKICIKSPIFRIYAGISILKSFYWSDVRSEYEQKQNDTNINTDAKNRAARSETKKNPCESRKIHEIQNLPNLCRNIDFEKFLPIGVRSEYEQKQNDTNINTDAKNRAARSETKKNPCESRKIHEIQNLPNLCRNIDFEKFLPIGVRSEYEQKQNDTNINTDAKNRAARSETKKNPCESRKIHESQNLANLCRNIDFEKFSPTGVRSEYEQKHTDTNINTSTRTCTSASTSTSNQHQHLHQHQTNKQPVENTIITLTKRKTIPPQPTTTTHHTTPVPTIRHYPHTMRGKHYYHSRKQPVENTIITLTKRKTVPKLPQPTTTHHTAPESTNSHHTHSPFTSVLECPYILGCYYRIL